MKSVTVWLVVRPISRYPGVSVRMARRAPRLAADESSHRLTVNVPATALTRRLCAGHLTLKGAEPAKVQP